MSRMAVAKHLCFLSYSSLLSAVFLCGLILCVPYSCGPLVVLGLSYIVSDLATPLERKLLFSKLSIRYRIYFFWTRWNYLVIHEPEWDMCSVLHCLIWTGVNNVLTGQTKATCSHIECGPQDRREEKCSLTCRNDKEAGEAKVTTVQERHVCFYHHPWFCQHPSETGRNNIMYSCLLDEDLWISCS